MTTFADIVADALSGSGIWPDDATPLAAAILADPRFADLLAGALHESHGVVNPMSQDCDRLGERPGASHRPFAAAIIRGLGETK